MLKPVSIDELATKYGMAYGTIKHQYKLADRYAKGDHRIKICKCQRYYTAMARSHSNSGEPRVFKNCPVCRREESKKIVKDRWRHLPAPARKEIKELKELLLEIKNFIEEDKSVVIRPDSPLHKSVTETLIKYPL